MDTKQQLGPGNGHHCMSALGGLKMGKTAENRLKAGLLNACRLDLCVRSGGWSRSLTSSGMCLETRNG
jgi:hypothetical protein